MTDAILGNTQIESAAKLDQAVTDSGIMLTMILDKAKDLVHSFDDVADIVLTLDRILLKRKATSLQKEEPRIRVRHKYQHPFLLGETDAAEFMGRVISQAKTVMQYSHDTEHGDLKVPDISAESGAVADLFITLLLYAAYREVDLAGSISDKLCYEATGKFPFANRKALVPESFVGRKQGSCATNGIMDP